MQITVGRVFFASYIKHFEKYGGLQMKTIKSIIDGHEVVRTGLSLYIDGRMEYQAMNLVTEYGQKLNGCRYAVASANSQKNMEEKYGECIEIFRPYIFLTNEEFAPIRESQRNNDKYHKKELRDHELYGFTEDLTEIANECCFLSDEEPNAIDAMIEIEENEEFRCREEMMRSSLKTLTDAQRRRSEMYFVKGMSFRRIAEVEGIDERAVRKSVEGAKKKIREYFKKNA